MISLEYAKAIYEIAEEERKVDLFNEYFVGINNTLNDDFINLLKAPTIDKNKKKQIVSTVYKSIDKTFRDFLVVLVENDRIEYFKEIGHQYRKLVRLNKNIVRIDIFSAKELTNKQMNNLVPALKAKYVGMELEIKNFVNPSLIGGIQIVANGESIDMSLKTSLERLKESL
ncbi:MAG: ATP synthase F1 subunit delta [Acholeplasmatales bacterium]|nr:ATP synthase F1 subunit delta [Acholeplasmatales bacterium]